MSTPSTILYIQHAVSMGGSALSLLYTLNGLDKARFKPVVCLIKPSREMFNLYDAAGYEVISKPGITTFEHTTAGWATIRKPETIVSFLWSLASWKRTQRHTLDVVKEVSPDIVHLNSAILAPSATALAKNGVPFVWHVRESPANGLFGLRKRWITYKLETLPDELILICESDQSRWVRNGQGCVIHNFVDFSIFNPDVDGAHLRNRLAISEKQPVILYLGGLSNIKGIHVFVDAMCQLREKIPDIVALMPSAKLAPPPTRLNSWARRILTAVGSGTACQRTDKRIRSLGLDDHMRRLPFQKEIWEWIAAADLLVFPSIRPHFARPIMEAAAMGKPTIGSRLGGVTDLIDDGETGVLVQSGDADELAEAIHNLLMDNEKRKHIGMVALEAARAKYDTKLQVRKIMRIYDSILTHHENHAMGKL